MALSVNGVVPAEPVLKGLKVFSLPTITSLTPMSAIYNSGLKVIIKGPKFHCHTGNVEYVRARVRATSPVTFAVRCSVKFVLDGDERIVRGEQLDENTIACITPGMNSCGLASVSAHSANSLVLD